MSLTQGINNTFWGLLGASSICIMMSFVMMNEARDRVHKGLGKTNSNTRLATANMFLYIIVVIFFGYAFVEYYLCKREAFTKSAQPSLNLMKQSSTASVQPELKQQI